MRKDTLRSIVADFLLEAGVGEDKFTRAYHIGVRALKELAYDVNGENKTEKLFIEPDGTAELPQDCLKVTKIGPLNSCGEIQGLTRNSQLSKVRSTYCGECSQPLGTDCGCRDAKYPRNVAGTSATLRTYASPLGVGSWTNIGEYRIDGDLVYLSQNCIGRDIYVEYNSFTQEDELGDMYVHPYLREAVIAFIRWKFYINIKTQYKQDKGYYQSEWHREKRNAKYRLKSNSKQELNQNARQHTKGALKS